MILVFVILGALAGGIAALMALLGGAGIGSSLVAYASISTLAVLLAALSLAPAPESAHENLPRRL